MKCPGQDTRYWTPEDIFEVACPKCGHPVEFFKDEPLRRCKNCAHKFVNPKMDFGCAAYCKYAEQCLGALPPELLAQKDELFKNRVAIEMKHYFHKDFKRIGHAAKVARYAEQIAKKEKVDVAVVLTAAYLHNVGSKETEQRYSTLSTSDHQGALENPVNHQEALGAQIAGEILKKLRADPGLTEEVCDIISHQDHPRSNETANFKAFYDAHMLASLEERNKDQTTLQKLVDKKFFTEAGKALAREILLKKQTP